MEIIDNITSLLGDNLKGVLTPVAKLKIEERLQAELALLMGIKTINHNTK